MFYFKQDKFKCISVYSNMKQYMIIDNMRYVPPQKLNTCTLKNTKQYNYWKYIIYITLTFGIEMQYALHTVLLKELQSYLIFKRDKRIYD